MPDCHIHAHNNWLRQKGESLAINSGYSGGGNVSAGGEHFQWQLARVAFSFLIETANEFQPPYASALSEAKMVFPVIMWMLELETGRLKVSR